MEWVVSDRDNDGLTLLEDLDADGDGKDFLHDKDSDNDGIKDAEEAAIHGKSMEGIPTDYLMGKYFNVLGRIGRVVCVDVPIQSYLMAGASFPALLKRSAASHPDWFEIDESNKPENEFFYRRVRNYYDLFTHHPGLEIDHSPRVGDWAFYGRGHVALVVWVGEAGKYFAMEAYWEETELAEDIAIENIWGPPDFFGRVKR